jgi:hypothetical protein
MGDRPPAPTVLTCGYDAARVQNAMSALPPKADIAGRRLDVRFVPKADIRLLINDVVCAQANAAANALPSVPLAVSR